MKPKRSPEVPPLALGPLGPTPIVGVWRFFAIVLSVLALVFGVLLLRIPWVPATDFDVIGFLWLVQNLLPISVLLLFLICVTGAGYYWFKVWLAGQ